MRLVIGLAFILIQCLPNVSVAQPDTLWTKFYGGGGTNVYGADIRCTSDGGFIVLNN